MGPRPFERGNIKVNKGGDNFVIASMGPRPFERGNDQPMAHNVADFYGASMGPRPFERGNAQATQFPVAQNPASMGPRPFERGNHRRFTLSQSIIACFNGAAPFRARKLQAQ